MTARQDAAEALAAGHEVFVSGFELPGAHAVPEGWGAAVAAAVRRTKGEVLAVQAPPDALDALTEPALRDEADVVVGQRVPP
ncbi:MAG TPA: hypothetical protein VGD87_14740, partial [Archangium sp.]